MRNARQQKQRYLLPVKRMIDVLMLPITCHMPAVGVLWLRSQRTIPV